MKSRPRILAASSAGVVLLGLGLTACGGGGDEKTADGAGFEAAVGKVVNPSDKKGGTLRMAISSDIESTDPGDMYYAWSTNYVRLYSRMLLTYASKPGDEGRKPSPDLAESLGVPSADKKTWTYKLRRGMKYEDGTEIKAKDIKYAVARTFDRAVLRHGPSYFSNVLDAKGYKGPYKDKNLDNFKGVETPDDYTVVFKLKQPFAEFNELVNFSGQTAPVPQDKDKGERYGLHPISSGPYKWEKDYQPGKGGALVRNPNWDQSTDTNRKQLPDRIETIAGLNAEELDNQLLKGQIHVDLAGSGVQDNARKSILTDPKLKAQADNPPGGFHWYNPIDMKVVPNVECRKAMVWAADRDAMWRAFGGDVGGELATSIMPPDVEGREKGTDYYTKAEKGYKGNVDEAKKALAACGKPQGFETTMIYREDRPKEKAVAVALQQSLARVNIKLNLKGYPASTYTSDQIGSPSFMKKNNVGIGTFGWLSDWPTGYGYLWALSDKAAIIPSGNVNISQIDDPEINQAWEKSYTTTDAAERAKLYNMIDDKLRKEAAIMPSVYAKSLLFRPSTLTNVFFHKGFGMYNYSTLGVTP
ncbi:ABC transporter substrate-binding protein [Spirillospora sp. NPDC127200]